MVTRILLIVILALSAAAQHGPEDMAWFGHVSKPAVSGGGESEPDPPATYNIAETFEGPGYVGGPWTHSIGAGSSITTNYSTAPLVGGYSGKVNRAASESSVSYRSFTSASQSWGRFKFRFTALPTNVQFLNLKQANAAAIMDLRLSSGFLGFIGAGTNSVNTMTSNTTYYIWWHYTPGSGGNAVREAWFSTDATKPSNDSGNYAYYTNGTTIQPAGIIQWGHTGGSVGSASESLYDNIYVSTNSF